MDKAKAVNYRSQVVAGTNYFVKVNVGGDDHAHLRIFKPLPHTGQAPNLVGVQANKKLGDTLDHF